MITLFDKQLLSGEDVTSQSVLLPVGSYELVTPFMAAIDWTFRFEKRAADGVWAPFQSPEVNLGSGAQFSISTPTEVRGVFIKPGLSSSSREIISVFITPI